MKKLALLTVIVTLGLLKSNGDTFGGRDGGGGGWSDWGFGPKLPAGFTSVDIDLVALEQGSTTVNTNTGATSVHFNQSKIDNNDILALINGEFGTSFSRTNGDRLAVSNFWDGKFIVLNSTGAVLLANASLNTNGDHYRLLLSSTNTVFAGTQTTNYLTKLSATEGSLTYESGNGSNAFTVTGFTTVNDSYYNDFSNSVESFQLSGGIGSITGTNGTGVLTGSVSGSGKDNAPAP